MLLLSISKAQQQLTHSMRKRRLTMGLTQKGLALRSGVSLPTLRKFEQKGFISLASFLKLLMVLDGLENLIEAIKPQQKVFSSIEDILEKNKKDKRKAFKKGWHT